MLLKDFYTTYNIPPSQISMAKAKGILPLYIFDKTVPRNTKIDESWVLRRVHFRNEVQFKNIEMYNTLFDDFKAIGMSRIMARATRTPINNWQTWLDRDLWASIPEGIMNFRLPMKHYLFYRIMTPYLRKHLYEKDI